MKPVKYRSYNSITLKRRIFTFFGFGFWDFFAGVVDMGSVLHLEHLHEVRFGALPENNPVSVKYSVKHKKIFKKKKRI